MLGGTPEEVLAASIAGSSYSEGVLDASDALIAHWGWRDRGDGGADVWMLSFPDIEENRILAARKSRREVHLLLERFEFLHAEVEMTYKVAIRWLQWLGFKPVHIKVSPVGGSFQVMERRKWGV